MLVYLESSPLSQFRLFILLGSPTSSIAWLTSDRCFRLTTTTQPTEKQSCPGITWIWKPLNVYNVCSQGAHYSDCFGASGSQYLFYLFIKHIGHSRNLQLQGKLRTFFVRRRNWYRYIRICEHQRGNLYGWRNSRTIFREYALNCRVEINIYVCTVSIINKMSGLADQLQCVQFFKKCLKLGFAN